MATFFVQPGLSDGKDTHIQFLDLAWNNFNFGAELSVEMGARIAAKSGDDVLERGLFEFDLSGAPAGIIIDDAELQFIIVEAPPNITTWEIVRLIQDFTEGTGATDGASGTTHDGSTAWPGGDGALADTDSGVRVTFTPPSVIGQFEIDVKDLVVDAIDNRSGILRMLIRDTNEVPATDTRLTVRSSSFDTPSARPRITINKDQGHQQLTMGAG